MNEKPKSPDDREIWDAAIKAGEKEPRPEITDNRPAIRAALKAARMRHTVRVKSLLP